MPDTPRRSVPGFDAPDHAELAWRPLSAALLQAWHPLRIAINQADGRPEAASLDDLHDELEPEWIDLTRDSVIGFDAEGVPRAFAMIELRPSDVTLLRAHCWGGVHPDSRGRGIGRALLEWQHRRGSEIVDSRRHELGNRIPGILTTEVPDTARSAVTLLTRAGLTPGRPSLAMRRSLELPVERAAPPDGLTVTPFDPALDERVRRAHNTAFLGTRGWQPWSVQTWRQWETGHRSFRPDWTFLALARGEVAGYVLCAAYPDDWAALGWTQGHVAKLGVLPAWRGRGVARSLLTRAMTAFAADGMQFAGLDVDADNSHAIALYSGLGFAEWHRTTVWEMPL